MKRRSRSDLPSFDKASRLPLVLAVLVMAALVFQFVAADDVVLPDVGPIGAGRARDRAIPPIVSARIPATIASRAIFAPIVPAANGAGAVPSDPLGGVAIVGSVRIGRRAYAVVHGPGDRTTNVPVGGRIGDWRLSTLSGSGAHLVRGAEQLTAPFGGSATLATTNPPEEGN